MITVLIPIGEIPYFVHANVANVSETCGVLWDYVEFVYLTGKTIPTNVQAAFDAEETKCRVVSAPFEVSGPDCHLKLLDWAFRNVKFKSDWIVTQHADVFWNTEGWLSKIVAATKQFPNHVAIVPNDAGFRFNVDGKGVLRTQGYVLALNQPKFVEYELSFINGVLGNEEMSMSSELQEAIKDGRVEWTKLHRSGANPQQLKLVPGVDVIDGADMISLELAVRYPKKIAQLQLSNCFVHLWHFFDMYYDISREGDTLIVNRTSKMSEVGAHCYSWASSYLFDKDEFKDKILPWRAEQIHNFCVRDDFGDELCELLKKYSTETNIVGEGFNGLTEIQFTDITLPLNGF